MEPVSIEESLERASKAVEAGDGLGGTGFWGAVARLKKEPELVDRYGDRVAEIDRAAFERWALLTVPIGFGTALMIVATLIGLVLIALSYGVDGDLLKVVVFGAGFGVLLVTTHGLAHLLVGKAGGMSFTHWFIGTIGRPQPGVKLDYATYLRAPARSRAWMHASGAIVTKLIPFLLLPAAVAAELPEWAVWAIAAIGVVTIVTDVLWSTKASDWKKYRREMRYV